MQDKSCLSREVCLVHPFEDSHQHGDETAASGSKLWCAESLAFMDTKEAWREGDNCVLSDIRMQSKYCT